MKKFFALLLAAMMLMICGVAFAEQEHEEPKVAFNIKMDNVPAGYQYETVENGGALIATFKSEDPDALVVYASVEHSCDFEGFTFDRDLTEEELALATDALAEDYSNPTIEVRQTKHGTRMIIVQENIEKCDYADIITVWHGYVFTIGLQKTTEITEADIQLATEIVGDMWVVEK